MNRVLLICIAAACTGCSPDFVADAPRVASATIALGAGSGPETPTLIVDVHLFENNSYTREVIPPFRGSADGRIAVDMKPRAQIELYLLGPEALTDIVTDPTTQVGGTPIVLDNEQLDPTWFHGVPGALNPTAHHRTICDATEQFYPGGAPHNPHPCGSDLVKYPSDPINTVPSQDCYELTMVSTVGYQDNGAKLQLWGKKIVVVVDDPKTASATISQVVDHPDPAVGSTVFYASSMFEPTITGDGRLLVGRITKSPRNPNDGVQLHPNNRWDIVYSAYDDQWPSCDVTRWTELAPIASAYNDPMMNGRYGVAAYPFRDPHGNVVPSGVDLEVSYPWIDRAGDNLFFTTIAGNLFNDEGGVLTSRHPARCLPTNPGCALPTQIADIPSFEYDTNFLGVGFAGLWSHGKIVLLDNVINNVDYALERQNQRQVLLDLYAPSQVSAVEEIRTGSGRSVGGSLPHMTTTNGNFIDSLEQRFNYNENTHPLTVRDVVWLVNTGRVSAELAFDDYLDPDAFIVAEMSGALEHSGLSGNHMIYHDGFDSTVPGVLDGRGTQFLRFQNAATATPDRWVVPAYGTPRGNVRLEPVALGGIEGKGLWLGGDGGVSFAMDESAQPQVFSGRSWYLSLFIDPRFDDDGVTRELLRFPDNTSIVLEGLDRLVFRDTADPARRRHRSAERAGQPRAAP